MDLLDDAGRRKIASSGHRISYLVTCRGVPLKIRHTAELPTDGKPNDRRAFKTNRAAVDSELALIAQNETKRDGWVPNPIFRKNEPYAWDAEMVVRVSRLDGPSYPSARRLITSALEAESRGLIGRAMVDIGGPHELGDKWFTAAEQELVAAGWAPMVHRAKGRFRPDARADMVAFYFGWYTGSIDGPFALPGYEFAPGAVAFHLHSYSAQTLRLLDGGWTGPFVARGVAASVGNVYEPYLEFTHQPQLMLRALLGGATWGEAAWYSMSVLSWQSMVVGDPLYRPMAVSWEAQSQSVAEMPGRFASYVALREWAAVAESEGDAAARIEALARVKNVSPSLALVWTLARTRDRAGDRSGAIAELGLVAYIKRIRVEEIGLVVAAARQLAEWEQTRAAVATWENVLALELPEKLRLIFLREAETVAREAGAHQLATAWSQQISALQPPAAAKN
jgi:uncharacterized protein (TIGR03790 family)